MNKKKITKLFIYIFFTAFIISYVIEKSGYYEYNLQNRTILTNEKMKEFEEDINNGKDVKLEEYLIPVHKDYTTTLTRSTNKLSLNINKTLKKGIEGFFKVFGSFFKN